MKDSLRFTAVSISFSFFLLATLFIAPEKAAAATSPYVTVQTNVPLNQATSDTVNGQLPYFNSHTPQEGSVETLTDATSPNTPDGNVILGPDNTWIGVAWDFGAPPQGFIWQLDRLDAWISAGDELRRGIQADLSISNTGDVNDFGVIQNSKHWAGLSYNANYNHVRWDFPTNFVAGETSDMDKYPVQGFRYLRLNSRGDAINGTDWQTRFVEVDIWVSAIPDPTTPRITSVSHDNGEVTFSWTAVQGRTYRIEYKGDLNDSEWTLLETRVASIESEQFTDSTLGGPQRFYHIVLEP